MMLHFSQILRTEALTFIAVALLQTLYYTIFNSYLQGLSQTEITLVQLFLSQTISDSAFGQIVRSQFYFDAIAG